MASKYDKTSLDLLLGFQTRLQGVGNSLAADLAKIISSTDAAVLKTVINQLPSGSSSVKTQMRELEKIVKEIERIRKEGFDLAEMKAFAAGPEIVKRAGETVAKIADNRGKIFKKELTDKQISDVLNYHPIDGKSISQWFHAMKTNDLERITQTVQRATVEGMSVAKVVKAIRGTKENDYKDGVLETTRQAATMTARTVVNGVASNAMLETCVQNADVIDGVKFIATLDAKTCPFCGSYDGKVWKPEDAALVKRPPLHPNCRCTVIPYVDMGPELEGERPAAAADFDKLAQDAYNKQAREKGWKRRFDDLSPSTRLKYYYQAQKNYEKRTGKPAYSQVKGNTTFQEYFEGQPEAFQRSWLGPKRFALYQQGKYDPLHLANPDTGYVATLDELKKVAQGGGESPGPLQSPPPNTNRPQNKKTAVHSIPSIKEAQKILGEIEQSDTVSALDKQVRSLKKDYDEAVSRYRQLSIDTWGTDEWIAAVAHQTKAEVLLREAHESRNKTVRDELLNRLFPIDDPNSTNRQNVRKVNILVKRKDLIKNAKEGLDFVARVLDNTEYTNVPFDQISVDKTRDRRSGYSPARKTINLTVIKKWLTPQTTPHEGGHAVEDLVNEIWSSVKQFYEQITTDGNGNRNQPQRIPKTRKKDKEYYRKAEINMPSNYCTKEYTDANGNYKWSEMLSSFFEFLYDDPVSLITKCPEYYEGMVKCLNRKTKTK